MEILTNLIQYMLDLGAPIVLPIIMILIGLLFGVGFRKAFSAGLLLGVAFSGMNVVLSFLFTSIGPASSAFVEHTGLQLTAIDIGWAPVAAIAWGWPYAFLMFPLQIGINIAMLALNWTSTLNVDMWNVWAKVLTGLIVATISNSVVIAFVFCAIEIIIELKQADWSVYLMEDNTGIPGVALPHSLFFEWIIFLPLNRLMDKIPFIANNSFEPEALREKIGIFAENHVSGFLIGVLIAIFAGYDLKGILTLGIEAGTALTLFPMVATLFITALLPIADGAKEFLESRFPGRTFYIGLDWPFAAGLASIWVAAILNVPVLILWSIILPGNIVLPFGGIVALCSTIPAALVTHDDVLRTTLMTWIAQPLWIYAGTWFAEPITQLARQVGAVEIPADVEYISWVSMEAPSMRMSFAAVGDLIGNGNVSPVLLVAVATTVLFFWSGKMLREENHKSAVKLGKVENND